MKTISTALLGEVLIDLIGSPAGGFKPYPGGSMFNTALTLTRLGFSARLYSQIGDDYWGRYILNFMNSCGMENEGIIIEAGAKTPLAFASIDDNGEAAYDFYKHHYLNDPIVPETISASIFHFGSYYSVTPCNRKVVESFLKSFHQSDCLITYDPNIRKHNLTEIRPFLEQNLQTAHVVKASTDDLTTLFGPLSIEDAFTNLFEYGPLLVIITDGANGSYASLNGGSPIHKHASPVKVVDTVGAGDAFSAAMLYQLSRQGINSPAALQEYYTQTESGTLQLDRLLGFCNKVAAASTGSTGARIEQEILNTIIEDFS